MDQIKHWWSNQSLERQFLLGGSFVALIALVLVGGLATSVVKKALTRNAAASTALYVDSIIAPLLPDLRKNTVLGDGVEKALDETLAMGALGKRLVGFKLWRQ